MPLTEINNAVDNRPTLFAPTALDASDAIYQFDLVVDH